MTGNSTSAVRDSWFLARVVCPRCEAVARLIDDGELWCLACGWRPGSGRQPTAEEVERLNPGRGYRVRGPRIGKLRL